MPIPHAVSRVLFEDVTPRDAVQALLSRDAKAE
jgi:glycerol-3-phosphate dehydrogenase (NAD(P)+)